MRDGPDIARIAALIGDPARANMLTALMSGQALTVGELAREAGVTIQTASAHLAKLADGGLLRPRKQGRHKYFTLATDDVARTLESLTCLAAKAGHRRTRSGPNDARLRMARVCYDHLAGAMGVHLFDSLVERNFLESQGESLQLTPAGAAFMHDLHIDLDALRAARAPLCRECLDWSERRPHLAGSLGRALLRRFEELSWAQCDRKTRIVRFTSTGAEAFHRLFPLMDRPQSSAHLHGLHPAG